MAELISRYYALHPVRMALGLAAQFSAAAADSRLFWSPVSSSALWHRRVHTRESINTISELGLIFMLFIDRARDRPEEIVRAGACDPVRVRRAIAWGLPARIAFFMAIGLPMGKGGLRCALSLHRLCTEQHGHYRQVLYEKRDA